MSALFWVLFLCHNSPVVILSLMAGVPHHYRKFSLHCHCAVIHDPSLHMGGVLGVKLLYLFSLRFLWHECLVYEYSS